MKQPHRPIRKRAYLAIASLTVLALTETALTAQTWLLNESTGLPTIRYIPYLVAIALTAITVPHG